ncbi:hypothetical protein AMTR_s00028p00208360 [Amborella trichopoda]|uniref:Uncharacterized protein n=1 Tax=Amborella trichopoda TaxID=13333 RepID=W1PTN1_AMBTC|nr:hypothetical protein AMTR_s00028p00208360 [Amborella trichopoda]
MHSCAPTHCHRHGVYGSPRAAPPHHAPAAWRGHPLSHCHRQPPTVDVERHRAKPQPHQMGHPGRPPPPSRRQRHERQPPECSLLRHSCSPPTFPHPGRCHHHQCLSRSHIQLPPLHPPLLLLVLALRYTSILLNIASVIAKIFSPLSSDSLCLASSNVCDNPLVRFNYFEEGLDLQRYVEGVKLVARVLRTSAMDQFKFPRQRFGEREFWYLDDVRLPANVSNDDAIGEFC